MLRANEKLLRIWIYFKNYKTYYKNDGKIHTPQKMLRTNEKLFRIWILPMSIKMMKKYTHTSKTLSAKENLL